MTTPLLQIAVIGGTGAEGCGIALRLAKAGHGIILGSRNAQRATEIAAELSRQLPPGTTPLRGMGNEEAAAQAQLIILTVPYVAQQETAEALRAQLDGKILVDATVPLQPPKVARVQLPEGGSAVAALQRRLGAAVRVVSAFQNVSAHHLRDISHVMDCDVLVCGDDIQAREQVIALAGDMGLRAYHAGPIENSAAAEALTSILISINVRYKCPGAGIRITGLQAMHV